MAAPEPLSLDQLMSIDPLLSDEERMIRDTVRRFVRERYLPRSAELFEEEKFATDLIPEIAAMGLLGATLTGYGCAGMGSVAYGLALQELEYGDSGLRSFVSVQGSLAMWPIWKYGSEEQKQKYLPKMAAAELIGCFGLTEPDFGSNPAGMRTTARRDGDGWVLNGEKTWITNGTMADVAVVWARAEEGILGFLVERGRPGYSTSDIHGKWSMRASVTSSLSFADCRVRECHRLPGARGLKAPLSCLTQALHGRV